MISKQKIIEIAVEADVADEVLKQIPGTKNYQIQGHNVSEKQEKLARAAYEQGFRDGLLSQQEINK